MYLLNLYKLFLSGLHMTQGMCKCGPGHVGEGPRGGGVY